MNISSSGRGISAHDMFCIDTLYCFKALVSAFLKAWKSSPAKRGGFWIENQAIKSHRGSDWPEDIALAFEWVSEKKTDRLRIVVSAFYNRANTTLFARRRALRGKPNDRRL